MAVNTAISSDDDLPLRLRPPMLPLDIVESVLALLPARDLLSAASVNSMWRTAAAPSIQRRPPSLLLHTHTLHPNRRSAATATSAVEPTSSSWLRLPAGASPPFPLRSAASSCHHYTLSSSHLSFSSDPLLLRWTHHPAPGVWRVDPVVALVGTTLVAAGGVSGLEDEDPLAVEVSDGSEWRRASSMPDSFKCSATAYHLSGAVSDGRLHVVDRRNARTSSFDPAEDRWTEVADLLAGTDERPFAVAVAACGGDLVLAGVMGRSEAVTGVTLWAARAGTGAVEVGRMPEDMVERFARGREGKSAAGVWAVEVRAAEGGGDVYLYNPSEMGEVFCYGAGGEWRGVETGVEGGSDRTKTVAVTCSAVSVEELREAFGRSTGK